MRRSRAMIRNPLASIVDRPPPQAALAVVAAWAAFIAGLLAGGEIEDGWSFVIAGIAGAGLVWVGLVAASRTRTLTDRSPGGRAALAALALAAGTALGLANLAANWMIAEAHPAMRALLTQRMRTLALRPRISMVSAPLVEEVIMRLFVMSVIAWVVVRLTSRRGLAFGFALVASSLFFALLHLARPLPGDPSVANLYRTALTVKYTLAGLPLAWIFWRWGLPYSILCHFAANAAHLALQSRVF